MLESIFLFTVFHPLLKALGYADGATTVSIMAAALLPIWAVSGLLAFLLHKQIRKAAFAHAAHA
jgi:hypothetical protein